MPDKPSILEPDRMLAHYRLVDKIGEGGMGVVWRAVDTTLDREVALKSLPPEYSADAERMARFEREAKVLATLNHSGIATIHGLHHVDDLYFLVMELVPGEDLSSRIARGALPVDEALAIALQIADALDTAHESGVVHRDLKPANIRITPDGKTRILDFGLAKALESDAATGAASSLSQSPTLAYQGTVAGVILGTAAYMSPEQARGRMVDRRADIWAFGCVLYEMLSGSQTFTGETVSDTLASILKTEPDWSALPDGTPRAVRRLLERCLEKSPARRLRDIGEARIVLEDVKSGHAEQAESTEPVEAVQPRWRRWLPWGVALLMTLITFISINDAERMSAPGPVTRLSVALPDSLRLRRGEANKLAISPDGRRVAMVAQVPGARAQIYVRALGENTITPIEGTEGARGVAFSPDGKWLAFVASNKLRKISVRGGAATALTDVAQPRGFVWTKDGTIVFTPRSNSGLYRISDQGGTPVQITTPDTANGERTHRWPHVLPDGKHVIFTVGVASKPGEYDDAQIDVVPVAGGERKTVFVGASMAVVAETGHLILGRTQTLLAAPFDLGAREMRGSPVPVLQRVAGEPSSGVVYAGLASNGTLAYIEDQADNANAGIAWVSRDGEVTSLPVPPKPYRRALLSPDGNRVLLSVGLGGGQRNDVWLYDINTESMNRLTFDDLAGSPVWSPDGSHIAYYKNSVRQLAVKRSDGSGAERVVLEFGSQGPGGGIITSVESWSPDGSLIYMQYDATTLADLWTQKVDGSEDPGELVRSPYSESMATVSPDGRLIAFGRNQNGQNNVLVHSFPGGAGRWQVSQNNGASPRWSRDGKELFFMSAGQLWSCPIETKPTFAPGRPRALCDWPTRPVRGAYQIEYAYDPSPDGRRFIAVIGSDADAGAPQLSVALDWVGELERVVGR